MYNYNMDYNDREKEIREMLDDPVQRKKLAYLMIVPIKALYLGDGTIERQALLMKKSDKDFSKHVTWKDMEKHFGLNKSKCRRKYENVRCKPHWA